MLGTCVGLSFMWYGNAYLSFLEIEQEDLASRLHAITRHELDGIEL